MKDFFADCPWGKVPEHRKVDILVEPVHRSRGLLGGASKDGKMSKLAALAAKRRQKENTNPAMPTKSEEEAPQDDYAASLSKLTLSNDKSKNRVQKTTGNEGDVMMTDAVATEAKAKSDSESTRTGALRGLEDEPIVARTKPSAFAGTFLDTETSGLSTAIDSSILGTASFVFDFKDLSPDDIVYKAQTGRTR